MDRLHLQSWSKILRSCQYLRCVGGSNRKSRALVLHTRNKTLCLKINSNINKNLIVSCVKYLDTTQIILQTTFQSSCCLLDDVIEKIPSVQIVS